MEIWDMIDGYDIVATRKNQIVFKTPSQLDNEINLIF